jgi:hypothetical protein
MSPNRQVHAANGVNESQHLLLAGRHRVAADAPSTPHSSPQRQENMRDFSWSAHEPLTARTHSPWRVARPYPADDESRLTERARGAEGAVRLSAAVLVAVGFGIGATTIGAIGVALSPSDPPAVEPIELKRPSERGQSHEGRQRGHGRGRAEKPARGERPRRQAGTRATPPPRTRQPAPGRGTSPAPPPATAAPPESSPRPQPRPQPEATPAPPTPAPAPTPAPPPPIDDDDDGGDDVVTEDSAGTDDSGGED